MLGMDLTDDSLRGTPRRVAKMFVNEIFSGLNPKNRPELQNTIILNASVSVDANIKKLKAIPGAIRPNITPE